MANQLAITNFINVSVATLQQGLSAYNTSNLAIFSRDTFASSFGTAGYKIYLSPSQVATDFGTSSNTYAMSVAIFSQQPNILAGGGYLVVIPYLSASQTQQVQISFSGIPTAGAFVISYNSNPTASIAFSATATTIQTDLQAVTGLSTATCTGAIPTVAAPSTTLAINSHVTGIGSPFLITTNTLVDSLANPIIVTVTVVVPGSTGETLDQAIIRAQPLVQFFGVMTAEVPTQIVMLAAAAYIQTQNLIGFFVSFTSADVAPGGMLGLLATGGLTQSRALFYDDQLSTALTFMAAYAALGLSVNFNGSLTTITMNLKTLATIQPDPNITQTILQQAIAAGADTYASYQGVAKVLCAGANDFYDNQYNLQWFGGAIKVAYFNALATVNTKVPQTEDGMNLVKNAIKQVCVQATSNGFLAPGSWTSSTMFGNVNALVLNVGQYGYYIYSAPISQQLAAVRATRAAPVVQIAAKYAGAIQSGSVIVYVNP